MQYEQLLEDYSTLVADISIQQPQQNAMNDDQFLLMDESNGYYFEKDDIYEADIHVSIGTLYMEEFDSGIRTSSGTYAMTHFDQAVRLYEMSGDVDSTTNMALAKYNLFLLHLRDGNYRVAARLYNDAIVWLRKIDTTMASTDSDLYDDYGIDPALFTEVSNLQHQRRNTRNQQPYKSSKQQQQQRKILLKAETFTGKSKTESTTGTGRVTNNAKNEIDVDSGTDTEAANPTIYVDLQHFLSQNHLQQHSTFTKVRV